LPHSIPAMASIFLSFQCTASDAWH
jgi:hypothetical protein